MEASHILVQDEDLCHSIHSTLMDDPTQFGALAAKHSMCPSKHHGGSLGKFGPGQMVLDFETQVQALSTNELSACFKTQFGYHIARSD
jgi:peptidyl-prolyl cis-trans isomerase C